MIQRLSKLAGVFALASGMWACSGSQAASSTSSTGSTGLSASTSSTGSSGATTGISGTTGSSGSSGTTSSSGTTGIAGPDLLGIYDDNIRAFDGALVAATGRHVAIENQRETWGTDFNQAHEQYDLDAGIIPMISWAVAYRDSKYGSTCAKFPDIVSGKYDHNWSDDGGQSFTGLVEEAHRLRDLRVPVMIRFFKEFTDTEIDECFYGPGGPAQHAPVDGPMLVGTWRHVVDVFKREGANNVQWIWGPSANLFNGDHLDAGAWTYFYPGSNYVDWISNDNYNKSNTTLADYDADTDIQNWYAVTSKLGKPLMQAETGAGYDAGFSPDPMTQWITTAYSTVKNQYPAMKAFLWWSSEGQVDYTLQGPGLAVYNQMAADPFFSATDITPYFSSQGSAVGPNAPTGLAAEPHTGKIKLTWTASTSAQGTIDHYNIYRDGIVINASTLTSYADQAVDGGSSYTYQVDAVDSAMNRSNLSAPVQATAP